MGCKKSLVSKIIISIILLLILIQCVDSAIKKPTKTDKPKRPGKSNKTETSGKSEKCYGNWEKKTDKEICDNLVPLKFNKPQRMKSPFKMTGGQEKDYTYHVIQGDDTHVISDVYIVIHPPNPKVRFPFDRTGFKNVFNCYCCPDETTYQGRIMKLKKPTNPKDNRVSFQVEHNIQNFTIRAAVFQNPQKYWIIDQVPINRSFDKQWIVHP